VSKTGAPAPDEVNDKKDYREHDQDMNRADGDVHGKPADQPHDQENEKENQEQKVAQHKLRTPNPGESVSSFR
jgi:hypothetical protein